MLELDSLGLRPLERRRYNLTGGTLAGKETASLTYYGPAEKPNLGDPKWHALRLAKRKCKGCKLFDEFRGGCWKGLLPTQCKLDDSKKEHAWQKR